TLQSDGKIVVAGYTNAVTGSDDFAVARYLGDGVPPVVDAGGPYGVPEGGSTQLTGTAQGSGPLVFQWDLDRDGVFRQTGATALRGDEVAPTPTFSAAGLAGPTSVTVTLRVTDTSTGLTSTATATINVANVPPTVNAGPDQTVNEGTTVNLAGTFSDPGP